MSDRFGDKGLDFIKVKVRDIDLHETAKATGIPESKLRNPEKMKAHEREKLADYQAQVVFEEGVWPEIQRRMRGEPDPTLLEIANTTELPYEVVQQVAQLRRVTSIPIFTEKNAPFPRDLTGQWTKATKTKKGPKAQGYGAIPRLAKALLEAKEALTDIFCPQDDSTIGASLMWHCIPEEQKEHLSDWTEGMRQLTEVALRAATLKKDARGGKNGNPVPDWVLYAAGYLNSLGYDEAKFHELLCCFKRPDGKQEFGIEDGQAQWGKAVEDTVTDWSDPLQALLDHQATVRPGQNLT